jgi:hypothetical protein
MYVLPLLNSSSEQLETEPTYEISITYSGLRNNGIILGKQITEVGISEATNLLRDLQASGEFL